MSIKKLGRLGSTRAALAVLITITPTLALDPAPDIGTAKYEVRFMEDMIDHHTMALHMAMMCLDKAIHQELKTLCSQIQTVQNTEIAVMQGWLQQWYSVSYTAQMSNGHMQQMHRMHMMSATEFEMEFLKMMIRHHWGAVVQSAICVDRAYHEELREMCRSIILAQTAEIQRMRTMLCDWYGLCNYGPKGSVPE
jgi:uncharacterized protein (DUF305 family)